MANLTASITLPAGFHLTGGNVANVYGKSHKPTRTDKSDVPGSPMTSKAGDKPAMFATFNVVASEAIEGWHGMDIPAGTVFTFRAVGVPDNWA